MHADNPYGASQVRKSLINFIFGKGASAVVGFSILLLLVRLLSPQEYGVYIAMLAMLEITQLASNFGLIAVAHRYVPELRSKNNGGALYRLIIQLCSVRLVTLLIAAIFLSSSAEWVASLIGLSGYEAVLAMYLVVIVSEGFARYLDVIFDSLLLQGYSQVCILVRNSIRLIALIFFMYQGKSEISLLLWVKVEMFASVLGAIFSGIQLSIYARKMKLLSSNTYYHHSMFHKYFSFTGPNYLGQIVFLMYGPDVAKLIITNVLGVVQAGAFGFAASFVSMLQRYMPIFLLLGMVRPLFVSAHLQSGKDIKLNCLSNLLLKLNLFFLIPMMAYFLVCGDTFAEVLSGGKFPKAGGIMVALVILLVIQTWNAVLSLLAVAAENGLSVLNGTVLGLTGLVFGIYFLPNFGVDSICAGLIISEFVRCLYVNRALSANRVKVNWDWLGIVKIVLSALLPLVISFFVGTLTNNNEHLFLMVNFLIISFLFLFLAYFLKPFTSEERGMINKILPIKVFVW